MELHEVIDYIKENYTREQIYTCIEKLESMLEETDDIDQLLLLDSNEEVLIECLERTK